MSGRLVIVACGYAFNEFVGFDCYDVDNECFCVIWAKDISKHKIWGIDKGKIKELPTLSCEQDCYNQGFENSKLLRDYRNLPCIDVRTGTAYNINNCVVVSKYVSEGLTYYKCVCYNNNKQVGIFEASKLREMILGNNIYFCNLKKCSDRISPLGKSFYSDKSILNKLLLLKGKLSPLKYPSELEKLQQHSNQEAKKDIERRTSVILKDVSRYASEKGPLADLDRENRAYFVGAISNASNVMLPELQSLGIDNIIANKKELCRVANYIDSSTFLDELDNFVQYPCTDEDCKTLLNTLRSKYNHLPETIKLMRMKDYLNGHFENKKLGNSCSHCYTMKSLFAMSVFDCQHAMGFSGVDLKDEIYVDVAKRKIFSFRSFYTSMHEYIHYLSQDNLKRVSGFSNKNSGDYSGKLYSILTEGIVELLSGYFVEYVLLRTNSRDLDLLWNNCIVSKKDYSSFVNPFLKSLKELKNVDSALSDVVDSIYGYKYNVCLVLYLLKDLPVERVFNMFFTNKIDDFYSLCENHYGISVWRNFVNYGNSISNLNIVYKDYEELIEILEDGGDKGVK